jgi:hypothetical protein
MSTDFGYAGAIVGGVVGGVAGAIALATISLFLGKRLHAAWKKRVRIGILPSPPQIFHYSASNL